MARVKPATSRTSAEADAREQGDRGQASRGQGDREQGGPAPEDPWFGVPAGPADQANSPAAEHDAGFDPAATQTDWFLPGGRAALLPDSMTVAGDGAETADSQRGEHHPAAAGSTPPWASETTQSSTATPPPWENGPWPGPGTPRPSAAALAADLRQEPAAARRDGPAGPWTPRAVLITGLLPLVVPGLVVGVLGLSRSRSGEPVRRASLVALAASLAWAVVIVAVIAVSTGGSSTGCTYPAAVHQAYAGAMADISGNAPASQLATDLGTAASRANAAAAAASDIPVRNALFAMAADLQQARADVITQKAVPASLRAHLSADSAALTASCQA